MIDEKEYDLMQAVILVAAKVWSGAAEPEALEKPLRELGQYRAGKK